MSGGYRGVRGGRGRRLLGGCGEPWLERVGWLEGVGDEGGKVVKIVMRGQIEARLVMVWLR